MTWTTLLFKCNFWSKVDLVVLGLILRVFIVTRILQNMYYDQFMQSSLFLTCFCNSIFWLFSAENLFLTCFCNSDFWLFPAENLNYLQ